MLYNLKNKNYYTFKIFQVDKLDPRSYYIPFSTKEKADAATISEARYCSDKVQCLNGKWDFIYYQHDGKLPKHFETDKEEFDKIDVPSCWQFKGYEPPFYINVRYQFQPKPPQIPTTKPVGKYTFRGWDLFGGKGVQKLNVRDVFNSVGVYRKKFRLEGTEDKNYIVSFLGVAGCLDLYLNGGYVGYSEGAHNTAEFDLTPFAQSGENELVAVVHKWCNGSYLEDQDMFRNNGIFRDVLLYVEDKSFLSDIRVKTVKKGEKYELTVESDVMRYEGCGLKVSLEKDKNVLAEQSVEMNLKTVSVTFEDLDVKEWNAEEPNLYDLYVELQKDGVTTECVKKRVGFRTVVIEGNVFTVNGKPVKLLGVNHHDTSPVSGYYMTPEAIEKDIRVAKTFNVNCFRTSHYPPDPLLPELAAEYGLYVVLEADVEAHGVAQRIIPKPNLISNNLKWKEHFWDRVYRAYRRDLNCPAIVMWSLGNEAGGYKCEWYCYEKLKQLTELPIHYEGMIRTKVKSLDVVSTMYPSHDWMKRCAERKLKTTASNRPKFYDKPLYLCEYAHAMGVGPGSLDEYVELFYRYPSNMGGCIWEMNDHAVWHETSPHYTYGGDHGEFSHDGNFCVDGLFYPDRTPHTGAKMMRYAYRPVYAEYLGEDKVKFTNHLRFTSTDYLTFRFTLQNNGRKDEPFTRKISLDPMKSDVVSLPIGEKIGDKFLNIEYIDDATGRIVADEQLKISEAMPEITYSGGNKVECVEKSGLITVRFKNGKIEFSETTGQPVSYSFEGTEYFAPANGESLNSRMYTNIYRAPTDNDKNYSVGWWRNGYDKLSPVAGKVSTDIKDGYTVVTASYTLTNAEGKALFRADDRYVVNSNGKIEVTARLTPLQKGLPGIPKFGKTMELNAEFKNVRYYGRASESYPDIKNHSPIGVYEGTVEDLYEPYIKPQENGNRADTRYAVLRNDLGKGLIFAAEKKPFHFNVKPMSDVKLATLKHADDVSFETDTLYVSVDGFHRGIGSNSCGPAPLEKYVLQGNAQYEYSFVMAPVRTVKKID